MVLRLHLGPSRPRISLIRREIYEQMCQIKNSNVAVTDFVPFPVGKVEVLEGDFRELVHMVREGATGDGNLEVGVSVMEPSKVRYTFEGDHTVYIITGKVRVELENGEAVTLGAGDIASFPKGATSIWTVFARTREIFVISG